MRSLSEIETTVKRASKAIGFSWGVAEEVAKNIRLLEIEIKLKSEEYFSTIQLK